MTDDEISAAIDEWLAFVESLPPLSEEERKAAKDAAVLRFFAPLLVPNAEPRRRLCPTCGGPPLACECWWKPPNEEAR